VKTSTKRAQSIVGTNNDGGRPANDFYPTPPEATRALLNVEKFFGGIWECACGDGAMSRVLAESGYSVMCSDIDPRGVWKFLPPIDFLSTDALLRPNVVTNPPFRLSRQFAQHALDLGAEKVALLNKLIFLEGQERAAWLATSPLKTVWVFSKRLQLTRNGQKMDNGGMIAFAWFVWERGYTGRPMIGWI